MKGSSWQDGVLRALIVLSGIIAAVLFVKQGEVHVLTALAVGGTLGVFLVGSSERSEG